MALVIYRTILHGVYVHISYYLVGFFEQVGIFHASIKRFNKINSKQVLWALIVKYVIIRAIIKGHKKAYSFLPVPKCAYMLKHLCSKAISYEQALEFHVDFSCETCHFYVAFFAKIYSKKCKMSSHFPCFVAFLLTNFCLERFCILVY